MTYAEIKNEIDAANFDVLIGLIEDEHFEAKSGKYDFSNDSGKLELAKDVSSFANRSGGIIVIGAKTSDNPAFFGRRVDALSLTTCDLINESDYHNVIKTWIYPRPDNIQIAWVPSTQDSQRGLFYILIPNQLENLRPFLITKDVDPATNRKRKEILFGCVERLSHASDPLDIRALHSMLSLGRQDRWKEQLENRLASIEAKIISFPVEDRQTHLYETVVSRVTEALKASDLSGHRIYSLSISPLQTTDVQSLLNSNEGSIVKLMESPPILRRDGWGLSTTDRAMLIRGELRRAKTHERTVLDLYRDGTLIFACRADETFLGFNFGKLRINPIALVETTYAFFNFYSFVLKYLASLPNTLLVCIQFFHLRDNGAITTLAPSGPYSLLQNIPQFQFQAPSDCHLSQFQIDVATYNPGKAAFYALREIYAWFQIEENYIPCLTNDLSAIDPEKIKSVR
ncbi:MAG: ATP-binding protein [Bacteroidota bacterium]